MSSFSKPPDPELGHIRDGYPALASWIARDPDGETFVFRKFNRLAARSILHLQSKLIALEHEIDQLDEQARNSNDFEQQQSSRRWETLMNHAGDPQRPEKARVEKLNELKELLKEYYDVLIQQSQIEGFKGPNNRVITAFREYITGETYKIAGTSALPIISGRAKDFLNERADLIALHGPAADDPFSTLLQDHWAFQKRQTLDPVDRTTIYKNRYVVQTVSTISMIAAAILLIVAIISLYSVNNDKAKLGLVGMYTVLFALSVATLTSARRAEVFGATAAYAAVLVVFVSGDLGGSGSQCLVQIEGGIFKSVQCPR